MEQIQFNRLSEENLVKRIKENYYPEKKLVLLDYDKNEIKDIEKKELQINSYNVSAGIFIEIENDSRLKVLDLETSILINVTKIKGFTSKIVKSSIVYILTDREI